MRLKHSPVIFFEKTRERNEALDCRIYARAAASLVGIDRFKEDHWRMLESQIGIAKPVKRTENGSNTEIKRRKSNFL